MLQVICKEDGQATVIDRILSETTTLGVRYYSAHRRLLWRDELEVETSFGSVAVKRVKDPQGRIRHVPEYEVCRKIALENDLPLRLVYDTVAKEAAEKNVEGRMTNVE